MSGGITASLLPERRVVRRHEEDDLQRQIVAYLRMALPDDATFFAILNGGKRHDKEAARMVGLGLRAGVPDLEIIHAGRALFLELKAARGVLSEHQRQMHRKLAYCGCPVFLCRTLAEVESALRGAGVALRGSVAA